MTEEDALRAAEKAYREHIEGRPMVNACHAYRDYMLARIRSEEMVKIVSLVLQKLMGGKMYHDFDSESKYAIKTICEILEGDGL